MATAPVIQAVKTLVRAMHVRGFILESVGDEEVPDEIAIAEAAREPLPDVGPELAGNPLISPADMVAAGTLTWVVASAREVELAAAARRETLCPRPVPVWPRVCYWPPGARAKVFIDTTPSIGVDGVQTILDAVGAVEDTAPAPVLLCHKVTPKAAEILHGFEIWPIAKLQVDPTFNMENPPPCRVYTDPAEATAVLKTHRATPTTVARVHAKSDATARFMGLRPGTLLQYYLQHPGLGRILQFRIVVT